MRGHKISIAKRGVKYRAEEDGSKFYFTDKACKHGHVVFRRTISGECLTCETNRRLVN